MGRAVPPQIIFFFRIHFPLYMDFDSPQLIKMMVLDKAIPRSEFRGKPQVMLMKEP